jgi:DNA-binding CsgD family transcriptional regulator
MKIMTAEATTISGVGETSWIGGALTGNGALACLASPQGVISSASPSWSTRFGSGIEHVAQVLRPFWVPRDLHYRDVALALGFLVLSCSVSGLSDPGEDDRKQMLLVPEFDRDLDMVVLLPNINELNQSSIESGRELEAQPVIESRHRDDDPDIQILTAREIQIVDLLAKGLNGPRVAKSLGIAESTVQTHIRNAMGKTGCSTRTGLVAFALSEGLVKS